LVRDAGAVAERPDVRQALDAKRLVDRDASPLVDREAELGEVRVGTYPGRPDERVGADPLAVGEEDVVRPRLLERRPDADLDTAAGELVRRVVAEAGRDLGEDLRRRVDEHPALPHSAERRVVAERGADEGGKLGERLDARVAGADEDEGELPLA